MSDESIIVLDDSPDDCDVQFLTTVIKVEEECIFVESVSPASTSTPSTSSAPSPSSTAPTTTNTAATTRNRIKRSNTDHKEEKHPRKKKLNGKASTSYSPTLKVPTLEAPPESLCISCCVCYEPYQFDNLDAFHSTLCGHIYCSSCIDKVVKFNKNCAVCRKKLTKKSYHRIFI